MTRLLCALAALVIPGAPALADGPASVLVVPMRSIDVYPKALKIRGADDAPQLIVTGTRADGRHIDLSGFAGYTVSDAKVARVARDGRVYPLANGKADITIEYAGMKLTVPVTAEAMDAPLPINFANHVVPVFTKLGCNSGGCHGKIAGQNGFRLSLLGFEPEFDYTTLMKEARGRRVFPAAPEQSLLLTKATGTAAHGGGKKTDVGSEEYKILRRWIGSGMPYGAPSDPTVTKVTVVPEQRVIDRNGRQQLAVYAHYSDGLVEDVTRRT